MTLRGFLPLIEDTTFESFESLYCTIDETATDSWEDTALYMGMSVEVVKKYIESKLFKPYITTLHEIVLKHHQGADKTINQSSDLRKVMSAIRYSVFRGDEKYTGYPPNTSKYEDLDWFAYCFYKIVVRATKNNQGMFWRKSVARDLVYDRCWLMIRRSMMAMGTVGENGVSSMHMSDQGGIHVSPNITKAIREITAITDEMLEAPSTRGDENQDEYEDELSEPGHFDDDYAELARQWWPMIE